MFHALSLVDELGFEIQLQENAMIIIVIKVGSDFISPLDIFVFYVYFESLVCCLAVVFGLD